MHKLSVQLIKVQHEAMERVMKRARIIVMTVHGFVMLASGQAAQSHVFKSLRVRAAICDEVHQLDITELAPVAAKVDFLLCTLKWAFLGEMLSKNEELNKNLDY